MPALAAVRLRDAQLALLLKGEPLKVNLPPGATSLTITMDLSAQNVIAGQLARLMAQTAEVTGRKR
jgi:hypothetical protein